MLPGTTSEQKQLSFTLEPLRRVFRVSDLNFALQRVLESDFQGISVAGEISGCKLAPSGHYYFSLKDEQSQLKAVLFKTKARYSKFKPQDGLSVIARGNLDLFIQRGEYQLIVETLEPQGAGALQLAFDQLKQKLQSEGLFDSTRKRPLPKYPKRIGIVTSSGGAVIRDILHILERRFSGLHIRLYPVQVQGANSVEQIREALLYFSQSGWPDVVIVARGGGAIEDLWSFNEEAVARAIAASSVPVISAIGHETDFTISDFVADLRAPTPSAAAELVICTKESLLDQVSRSRARSLQAVRYKILTALRDLNQKGSDRAVTVMHRAIQRRSQRLDDLDNQLCETQRAALKLKRKRLEDLTRRLQQTDLRLRFTHIRHNQELLEARLLRHMQTTLVRVQHRHQSLHLHLTQVSPLAILARGYSIVSDSQGRVLRSADETQTGEQVKIRLGRGQLEALIAAVHPHS